MRLLTWNIQMGRRLRRVVEGIASLPHLDLVLLQEASIHDAGEDAARVAEALGPTYRWWQVTAQELRGEPQANALIWDTRALDVRERSIVELPEPTGRVLSVLPPSRRSALRADARLASGATVTLHAVHLDVWGIHHKVAQFRAVLDDAAQPPRADVGVVAGDFNTYGPMRINAWPRLGADALERGFRDITSPMVWTHAAGRMRQKLDAVYVSPRQVRARAEVLPLGGSDHRPILAEVDA